MANGKEKKPINLTNLKGAAYDIINCTDSNKWKACLAKLNRTLHMYYNDIVKLGKEPKLGNGNNEDFINVLKTTSECLEKHYNETKYNENTVYTLENICSFLIEFSNENDVEINGIVRDIYRNILKDCKNLPECCRDKDFIVDSLNSPKKDRKVDVGEYYSTIKNIVIDKLFEDTERDGDIIDRDEKTGKIIRMEDKDVKEKYDRDVKIGLEVINDTLINDYKNGESINSEKEYLILEKYIELLQIKDQKRFIDFFIKDLNIDVDVLISDDLDKETIECRAFKKIWNNAKQIVKEMIDCENFPNEKIENGENGILDYNSFKEFLDDMNKHGNLKYEKGNVFGKSKNGINQKNKENGIIECSQEIEIDDTEETVDDNEKDESKGMSADEKFKAIQYVVRELQKVDGEENVYIKEVSIVADKNTKSGEEFYWFPIIDGKRDGKVGILENFSDKSNAIYIVRDEVKYKIIGLSKMEVRGIAGVKSCNHIKTNNNQNYSGHLYDTVFNLINMDKRELDDEIEKEMVLEITEYEQTKDVENVFEDIKNNNKKTIDEFDEFMDICKKMTEDFKGFSKSNKDYDIKEEKDDDSKSSDKDVTDKKEDKEEKDDDSKSSDKDVTDKKEDKEEKDDDSKSSEKNMTDIKREKDEDKKYEVVDEEDISKLDEEIKKLNEQNKEMDKKIEELRKEYNKKRENRLRKEEMRKKKKERNRIKKEIKEKEVEYGELERKLEEEKRLEHDDDDKDEEDLTKEDDNNENDVTQTDDDHKNNEHTSSEVKDVTSDEKTSDLDETINGMNNDKEDKSNDKEDEKNENDPTQDDDKGDGGSTQDDDNYGKKGGSTQADD